MRKIPSPYVLLFSGLGILGLIDYFFMKESFAYLLLNPNPYLLLSVVLAAIYGLRFSLIASAVTAVVFLLTVHFNVNYEEIETIMDFHYLSTPILLTITSVVIGELKQRSLDQRTGLVSEMDALRKNLTFLQNKESLQEKEITELKRRLVSRLETARSFHEIAISFHSLDEGTLVEAFKTALQRLFKTSSVVVEKITPETPVPENQLSRDALRKKKIVSLQAGNVLDAFGDRGEMILMAIPLVIEDQVEYLIRISEIPFLEYIPSNFNVAEIYTSWIQSSIVHGRSFWKSERKNIWNEDLQVYQYNHFLDRLGEEFNRSRAFMLPLSLVKLRLDSLSGLSTQKKLLIRKLVTGVIHKTIRKLDYVSEGESEEIFYVVFPISDVPNARALWNLSMEKLRPLDLQGSNGPIRIDINIEEFNPSMKNVEEMIQKVTLAN